MTNRHDERLRGRRAHIGRVVVFVIGVVVVVRVVVLLEALIDLVLM